MLNVCGGPRERDRLVIGHRDTASRLARSFEVLNGLFNIRAGGIVKLCKCNTWSTGEFRTTAGIAASALLELRRSIRKPVLRFCRRHHSLQDRAIFLYLHGLQRDW